MRATRAAIDLADSNPILLWLIASKVASNKLTYQKAKPLLESKQKAILKRMYPGSNALSVSFIKKIQATRYNAKEFQLVSALVENDANINSLRHCTQVNLDILSYFITEDYALKVPLVKSLISGKGKDIDLCGEIQIKIHEAMDAAWGIGHGNPMEALQRCSSYDQICTLHIRWVERNIGSLVMFEDEEFSDVSHFGLHMPMAPGTPEIEAITSISGLFIEGEEMEHCVAYFADDVINGEATVYRVLSPQRGTLMLLRSSNRFVIDEFRLAGNEEPNHESWALVRRWEKLINS
ncbi:hypothetical protein [Pseudodesulfovibrio nedwellii]|nr:hypothetical protein [Pseudodesulfovibrio nedwellii]